MAKKITFSSQEEKDQAIADKKAWFETALTELESAEVVADTE